MSSSKKKSLPEKIATAVSVVSQAGGIAETIARAADPEAGQPRRTSRARPSDAAPASGATAGAPRRNPLLGAVATAAAVVAKAGRVADQISSGVQQFTLGAEIARGQVALEQLGPAAVEVIDAVLANSTPLVLTRAGRPVAALVSLDDLERLQQRREARKPGTSKATASDQSRKSTSLMHSLLSPDRKPTTGKKKKSKSRDDIPSGKTKHGKKKKK